MDVKIDIIKNSSRKFLLLVFLLGGFLSAHAACADYYPLGTAVSVNLLSGKSDVAQITAFKATASVPAGTSLTVQFSADGNNWYDHNAVSDSADNLTAGANTIDLRVLDWKTANFYYKLIFTITDPAVTPVTSDVEVDYSDTYSPYTPPWNAGHLYPPQSALTSADLLSGLNTQFQNGAFFAYKISALPAGTAVTAQFSTDGNTWYSSAGTLWGEDTLSVGDHLTENSALSLAALGFHGAASFYYKLNFSTTDPTQSAAVADAGLLFDNAQLGGSATTLTSPIASYDFNEGYGATAHNGGSGGASLDGNLNSGSTGTNATTTAMWDKGGKFGGAMEFDGTDDRVDMNDAFYSDVFSICAWVNEASLKSQANVVIKRSLADEWELSVGNGYIHFTSWVNISSSLNMISNSPITINSWHHICAVQNGNGNTGYIYVDGSQQGSALQTAVMTNTASIVQVGALSNGNDTRYFNGLIDDTKIFNYALSSDQIKLLYNNNSAMAMGNDASRTNVVTAVTGAAKDYCIPGDTAQCDKPVGEWKMDEKVAGDAKTIYDTSGNGNNGTTHYGANASGMDCTVPGKYGSGCGFDGVDDYVDIGHDFSWANSNSFSLSAWIRPNNVSSTGVIMGKDHYEYSLNTGDGNDVIFYYWNNSASLAINLSYSNILQSNGWYYITVSYDGNAKSANLYVNGILKASNTGVIGVFQDTSYDMLLGYGYYIGGMHRYFNGAIDQVQIYNYARTPAQIAWDYNRGGPVAEWRMNECTGATVHDESGNSNDGTINLGAGGQTTTGTCTVNANMPWWNGRNGKYGASLNFDGGDDYIGVGTAISNVNAVSFWIKPASTTQSIIDLDGGTHKISISSGAVSATGFNAYYVDGKLNAAVSDTAWHQITAIANTSFNTTTEMVIGKIGAAYFSGQIDNVKIFNYALTAAQIKTDYDGGVAVGF